MGFMVQHEKDYFALGDWCSSKALPWLMLVRGEANPSWRTSLPPCKRWRNEGASQTARLGPPTDRPGHAFSNCSYKNFFCRLHGAITSRPTLQIYRLLNNHRRANRHSPRHSVQRGIHSGSFGT